MHCSYKPLLGLSRGKENGFLDGIPSSVNAYWYYAVGYDAFDYGNTGIPAVYNQIVASAIDLYLVSEGNMLNEHVWHGDATIATVEYTGGFQAYNIDTGQWITGPDSNQVIFDDDIATIYHSTSTSAGVGVTITFQYPVYYSEVKMHIRLKCCPERYKNVCLYADGTKIACTPANYVPTNEIFFNDFLLSAPTVIVASEFKLSWDRRRFVGGSELLYKIGARDYFTTIVVT